MNSTQILPVQGLFCSLCPKNFAHRKLFSPEEIRSRYGDRILMENRPPEAISGGMGSFIYLLWADDLEELEQQADFILRHADGSGWLGTKGRD